MTTEQRNKPGGETEDETPRPVVDRQAVKNQGEVSPEDYPDKASGKDAIGGNPTGTRSSSPRT